MSNPVLDQLARQVMAKVITSRPQSNRQPSIQRRRLTMAIARVLKLEGNQTLSTGMTISIPSILEMIPDHEIDNVVGFLREVADAYENAGSIEEYRNR